MRLSDNGRLWVRTKDELISEVEHLGFPGEQLARMLGSPKATEWMTNKNY